MKTIPRRWPISSPRTHPPCLLPLLRISSLIRQNRRHRLTKQRDDTKGKFKISWDLTLRHKCNSAGFKNKIVCLWLVFFCETKPVVHFCATLKVVNFASPPLDSSEKPESEKL